MITHANRAGAYRLWPREETEELLKLRAQGEKTRALAARFGRSPQGIKRKLKYEQRRARG